MTIFQTTAAFCLAACAGLSQAHTVLEYPVATAGQSYKAIFKVGHGCGNSPTRQFVVDIPAGVQGAQPYISHGRTITEDVSRISWTAKTPENFLPNGHYDEFVLVSSLPAQAGMMYWPVQQVCEQGRMDWVEVPKPGQKISDLKSPAAALEIMPGAGAAGHSH